MHRIAVTGANGHFGKTLVRFLREQDYEVRCLDLYQGPPEQESAMNCDVLDLGALTSAFHGCDGVVHLAAFPSPYRHPDARVYHDNTTGSYNVLLACELLGIEKVCLASSINAIGGVYSRDPQYDYFPVDEKHPTYSEDPYSLSKWILEMQGDCFARRRENVSISSMRFHWIQTRSYVEPYTTNGISYKHLWAYTDPIAAAKACLASLLVEWTGHEAFFIVAPETASPTDSEELIRKHYPKVQVNRPMPGKHGFYDCSKAERLLGWVHEDHEAPPSNGASNLASVPDA
ncbi:MAG: NAD-dependent epimerase/dehydratase family protein [bacterium]